MGSTSNRTDVKKSCLPRYVKLKVRLRRLHETRHTFQSYRFLPFESLVEPKHSDRCCLQTVREAMAQISENASLPEANSLALIERNMRTMNFGVTLAAQLDSAQSKVATTDVTRCWANFRTSQQSLHQMATTLFVEFQRRRKARSWQSEGSSIGFGRTTNIRVDR